MNPQKIDMLRKILLLILIFLIAIQFIRPARNNGNMAGPTDITHYVKVPDTVMHILKVACYDCHSNYTVYPWYVNINPVGLWMANHIKDGKRAINFSDLSRFDKKKLDHRMEDVEELVEKKEMPLESYTIIHQNAKLDPAAIQLLKEWSLAARKEIGYHQ